MRLHYQIENNKLKLLAQKLNYWSESILESSVSFETSIVWLDQGANMAWETIIAKEDEISWQFLTPAEQKLLLKVNQLKDELAEERIEYISFRLIELHKENASREEYRKLLKNALTF